jgi:hypothetical protein
LICIRYAEFIKDPLEVVQQLYKSFGWNYSDEFDKALRNEIESLNTKRAAAAKAKAAKAEGGSEGGGEHKNTSGHLAHTYSMEEYGLDEFAMRNRLSWYYKEYLNKDVNED